MFLDKLKVFHVLIPNNEIKTINKKHSLKQVVCNNDLHNQERLICNCYF